MVFCTRRQLVAQVIVKVRSYFVEPSGIMTAVSASRDVDLVGGETTMVGY